MSEQTKTEQPSAPKRARAANPSKTKAVEKIPTEKLQFVGKHRRINKKTGKPVLVERAAPAFIIDGTTKIHLPPADQQKKGAETDREAARKAKELFPDDFKTPTVKGRK